MALELTRWTWGVALGIARWFPYGLKTIVLVALVALVGPATLPITLLVDAVRGVGSILR